MALRATVYKAEINIADSDRGYYGSHTVTVARHPSETEERLMIRLMAYALYANADGLLSFTRGLSQTDEPALWHQDLTGAIAQWIEVGLPDERRVRKACGRAKQVIVLAYGRSAQAWWTGINGSLERLSTVKIYVLPTQATLALAALAQRHMVLDVNIQDGAVWVSAPNGEATVNVVAKN